MVRGNHRKRANRSARQVAERKSDQRKISRRGETENGIRIASIGFRGVIIAGVLTGLLTFGGSVMAAYISRSSASTPSGPGPCNHLGFHHKRGGFGFGDSDHHQSALWR